MMTIIYRQMYLPTAKLSRFSKVFFSLLLSCSLASAGSLDRSSLESILESILESSIVQGRGVGLVVGVIDGDKRLVTTVGVGDKKSNVPIHEGSIFEIASVTKTFTGILLADMAIKGEVKLDDPISHYLPMGTVVPMRKGQNISLLSLAPHRSSLLRLPSNLLRHTKELANPYATYTVEHLYEFLASYQLPRDINEASEYANLGMGLLGHILALKAGLSYEALVTERILVPLNMIDTAIVLSKDHVSNFVAGHDSAGNVATHWDLSAFAGAGAPL
jgi:CubicO group peptidase (beta-lactamase class C family)